jgi:hypothetical protein
MGTRWFLVTFLGKNGCQIWSPCQLACSIDCRSHRFATNIGVFAGHFYNKKLAFSMVFYNRKIGVFAILLVFSTKNCRCWRSIVC